MPKKPEYSDKIKNEEPDPKAFERFEKFAKGIVQVTKDEAERSGKADSRTSS